MRGGNKNNKDIHVQVCCVAFRRGTKRGCSRPRLVPPLYSPFFALQPWAGWGGEECFFLAEISSWLFPPPRQGSAFCRGLKQKLCGGGQQNTVKQRSEGLPAFPSPAANPVHVGKWLPTGNGEEEGPLLGFRHRIGETSRLKKKTQDHQTQPST